MIHVRFIGGPIDGACTNMEWPWGVLWVRPNGEIGPPLGASGFKDSLCWIVPHPIKNGVRYVIGGMDETGLHRLYHAKPEVTPSKTERELVGST